MRCQDMMGSILYFLVRSLTLSSDLSNFKKIQQKKIQTNPKNLNNKKYKNLK